MEGKKYTTLKEFYAFYLSEHQNPTCRKLHFVGTGLGLMFFAGFLTSVFVGQPDFLFILYGLLSGYSFAWVGHFFFEKNKPATFKYPFYSFASDFILFRDIIVGKESLNP